MLGLQNGVLRASRISVRLVVCLSAAMVMLGVAAGSAFAGAVWRVDSLANPQAAPGSQLTYSVQMWNVGNASAPEAAGGDSENCVPGAPAPADPSKCAILVAHFPVGITPQTDDDGACTVDETARTVTCQYPGNENVLPPRAGVNTAHWMTIEAAVDPSASGTLTASYTASGAGATLGSAVDPTVIEPGPFSFGIGGFDNQFSAVDGSPYIQAGGHPDSVTTSLEFNSIENPDFFFKSTLWPVAPEKDIAVALPPGFVGAPSVVGQCTPTELAHGSALDVQPQCPATSQIGTLLIRYDSFKGGPYVVGPLPFYNMTTTPSFPARFGFNFAGTVVTLDAEVRSDSDYGISIVAHNVPEGVDVQGSQVTIWGAPADPSHTFYRDCPGENQTWASGISCENGGPVKAFLRMPTSCTAPGKGLVSSVSIDPWTEPGNYRTSTIESHLLPGFPAAPSEWGAPAGTTGCDRLDFSPSFSAKPTAPTQANSPAGLSVDLSMPQNEDPNGLAEADLRSATVTFPQGVRLSPSSASGLGSCTEGEIGLIGTGFPEPNPTHFTKADPACPDSSKLGSVTITTPLLEQPLTGSLYLATPHENPFGSLVALYLVAQGSGVTVKLPGRVELDPHTGQVTTVFEDTPQLPFSNLHVELKSGPRAALAMPAHCGSYTSTATLTSWSGKTAVLNSPFTVSEGREGGPCPTDSFTPTFTAGSENPLAGAFSPFQLRLQRSDSESELSTLTSLSLPPGLLADVASVPVRCTQAQAAAASCPAASRVGSVNVGAGAGPNPLYVPGNAYLMGAFSSGPFKGDPFGLAVIVHAAAGPFDLGQVVVQSGIQIHDDGSITAQSEPFPQILQGIPDQLRDIQLTLDRPGFTLNPTSCNPLALSATIASTNGLTALLASRFQVGDCASLKFRPSFTASAPGRTSKALGAGLHVHVATGEGPGGREANIARVDVQLPKVLPSRLATLQKACVAAQFEKDPSGCPEGSVVGTAVAHTPILTAALAGPAILVSHGGQAFPDLVLVLQGEGVRIDLTGHTQIKKGITYSHFETVPDAPVQSFDLNLPESPHGVLTTDNPGARNLCANAKTITTTKSVTRRIHGHARKVKVKVKHLVAQPLLMPTTITAQNGAVLKQTTKIAVTGCPKATSAKTATSKHSQAAGNSAQHTRGNR